MAVQSYQCMTGAPSLMNTVKTALKGITKMHHFRFTSTHPGQTFVKNKSSDPEKLITIRKGTWDTTSDKLPQMIIPQGLSLERIWYLFQKIRVFCPQEVQDIVCPMPEQKLR